MGIVTRLVYSTVVLPCMWLTLTLLTAVLFLAGRSTLLDVFGLGSAHQVQHGASKTAKIVALLRYLGTFEGWSNDVQARRFLPWGLPFVIGCFRRCRPRRPISPGLFVTRTLAGDHVLRTNRPKQVVLLGAGLDSRAHHLHLPEDTRFYEVDIATTQQTKRCVVERYPNDFTNLKNCLYVPVDFANENFADKLAVMSSFDFNEPNTVILFEGVSMYLSWEELERTLHIIHTRFARGTILAMDCMEDFFTTPEARQRMSCVVRCLKQSIDVVGEAFQWGVPVGKTAYELICPIGFELVREVTGADALQDSGLGVGSPSTQLPVFWHYLIFAVGNQPELKARTPYTTAAVVESHLAAQGSQSAKCYMINTLIRSIVRFVSIPYVTAVAIVWIEYVR